MRDLGTSTSQSLALSQHFLKRTAKSEFDHDFPANLAEVSKKVMLDKWTALVRPALELCACVPRAFMCVYACDAVCRWVGNRDRQLWDNNCDYTMPKDDRGKWTGALGTRLNFPPPRDLLEGGK